MNREVVMTIALRSWDTIVGGPWRVLAGAEQTNGELLVGEARLNPGDPAPGLHVHQNEDEHVYVIDGTLTVEIGGERTLAHAGDFVTLPQGVPHVFGNLSDEPVRCLGIISPVAIEGFFRAQEEYFSTLDGPPDPAHLAEIGARYGITMLGAPLTH
jgi:quercetin dioxygenase-like cupin family protein